MTSHLTRVYQDLLKQLGPQSWWPGESPLEVIVGAVLTQNTAWRNVERAIANLKQADMLEVRSLHELHEDELGELIRPAGYFRLKAKRLKNLIDFVWTYYDGCLDAMFATPLDRLRRELLTVNGIGPETADSILLYGGNLPTFVVDAYTARIGKRHGWLTEDADYHQIQEHFEASLPTDVQLYNEFHAMIVRVGKEYCHKRNPDCDSCPLHAWLPEGGVIE